MSGLWRNQEGTREGKYLVQRRDGTIPEWPAFVIGAADPAAPEALYAYANRCRDLGFDEQYVLDIIALADEFVEWRLNHQDGDPDAPRHRKDDPEIIAKMGHGG